MKINMPLTGRERVLQERQCIISTTDLKGVITSANDDFVELSGFSCEDLLGTSHNIVRHPEMPPEAFADLWNTLKQDKPWLGIVNNRAKPGDNYWVDAYVSPLIENGK